MNWDKINSTVRESVESFRKNGRETIVHRASLAELIAKEPLPDIDAMTDEQLREFAERDCIAVPKGACREEIIELVREHNEKLWHARVRGMVEMLEYIYQDGPHPLATYRRQSGVVKAIRPSLTLNMSCAQLAVLCDDGKGARKGDGRATVSERIKRLYEEPIKKAGMRGYKAPFQKTGSACEAYSDSAQGNQNRLGSKYLELRDAQSANGH